VKNEPIRFLVYKVKGQGHSKMASFQLSYRSYLLSGKHDTDDILGLMIKVRRTFYENAILRWGHID